MKHIEKTNPGISMIELLLVFLIVTALVVVVFFVASTGEQSGVITNEKQNLGILQTGIRNIYEGGNSFNGVGNKIILDADVIPFQMRGADDGQIISKWGDVTVSSHRIRNEADSYEIRYTHVPKVYCAKLTPLMASSFSEVLVNGVILKNIDNNDINVAQVVSACNLSETDNTILFIGR